MLRRKKKAKESTHKVLESKFTTDVWERLGGSPSPPINADIHILEKNLAGEISAFPCHLLVTNGVCTFVCQLYTVPPPKNEAEPEVGNRTDEWESVLNFAEDVDGALDTFSFLPVEDDPGDGMLNFVSEPKPKKEKPQAINKLYLAIEKGSLSTLKCLLEDTEMLSLINTPLRGQTLLNTAVKKSDISIVTELLNCDSLDFKLQLEAGTESPLHVALSLKMYELLACLLLKAKTIYYIDPSFLSKASAFPAVVEILQLLDARDFQGLVVKYAEIAKLKVINPLLGVQKVSSKTENQITPLSTHGIATGTKYSFQLPLEQIAEFETAYPSIITLKTFNFRVVVLHFSSKDVLETFRLAIIDSNLPGKRFNPKPEESPGTRVLPAIPYIAKDYLPVGETEQIWRLEKLKMVQLIVPTCVDSNGLKNLFHVHSENILTLCWAKQGKGTLMRSSRLKCLLGKEKASYDDDLHGILYDYFSVIEYLCCVSTPPSRVHRPLLITDTGAKCRDFEVGNYTRTTFLCFSAEEIQNVYREVLDVVTEFESYPELASEIQKSGWCDYVGKFLRYSVQIAQSIEQGEWNIVQTGDRKSVV